MSEKMKAKGHTFGPVENVGLFAGVTGRQLAAGTACLLFAFVCLVALPPMAALPAALTVAIGGLFGITFRIAGKPGVDWTDVGLRHLFRRQTGRLSYRATGPDVGHFQRLGSDDPSWTEMELPEDLADIEFLGYAYHGQEAGVIYDAREHTYCATLLLNASAFQLLDPGEQQVKVEAWGSVVANLCRENSPVGRIQWIERTLPAKQDQLVDYLKERRDPEVDADAPAMRSYLALLDHAGEVQQQHQLFITLRIDATKRGTRKVASKIAKGHEGFCALLLRELDVFAKSLGRTGVTVEGVLRPRNLAEVVKLTYDPYGQREESSAGIDPATAGPMNAETTWDSYRADGAIHRTYWISEWPRVTVGPDFLSPVLLGGHATRTIAVTIEPIPSDKALRDAEAAVTSEEADEEFRQRKKFRTTLSRRRMQQAIVDREAELVQGYGEVRFAGFVTVSGRSESELDASCAELEHAATQSHLSLRPMSGEHGEALTYTMPLARGLRKTLF